MLDRLVAALVAGDPAAALTFVDHHGRAVADELRAAGVAAELLDPLVQEVALTLLGRDARQLRASDAVRCAVLEVLVDHVHAGSVDCVSAKGVG